MDNLILTKLQDFFYQYKKIELQPKEIIFRPGYEIDNIFYIESGTLRQYTITKDGEEMNLHIFTKGSYFPMMLLMSNAKNKYYFETLDQTILYKAPASVVLEFVRNNPDILFDLTTRFAEGICKLLIKSETTLYKDSYDRIISILLFLANKLGKEENGEILIDMPLTHSDIASWVGLQRETASRQLELLQSKNIISYKKQIIRVNMEKLLAEQNRKK